jgi:hypothetical protein
MIVIDYNGTGSWSVGEVLKRKCLAVNLAARYNVKCL